MFDKADDELIERLIKEAEAIIEEELQKKLAQDLGLYGQTLGLDDADSLDGSLANQTDGVMNKQADSTSLDKADEQTAAPAKKRRGRPPKSAKTSDEAEVKSSKSTKAKSKTPFAKSLVREPKGDGMTVKEAILEFVEREDGVLTLQEVGAESEPMVTIAFSEQAKSMIGRDDIQLVGQSMIHAAIATVMQKQMNAWHAHVYDEVPKRYS